MSAPAESQSVSGEFLFHTRSVIPAALPPEIAGTDFSKHAFSLLPSSCACGFVGLAEESEGPAR